VLSGLRVARGLTRHGTAGHNSPAPGKEQNVRDPRADDELLAATAADPAAFGVFYERHEDVVLMFLLRRTRDAHLAADLAAETFAEALCSAHRFRPGPAPAVAWLLGIARNVLAMSRRRGRVEDAARRRLGMERVVLDDDLIGRVWELQEAGVAADVLAGLPEDHRRAIWARVVDERDYGDIARELCCSESVVRKRVSRGLSRLRARLGAEGA
jgi:RNA polymerase sigma factor (sigma-70 family)